MKLVADHTRYFSNPCADNPDELARFVDNEWLKSNIKRLTKRIVSRQIPVEECSEGGPYTGTGGIGYAFLRVAKLYSSQDMLEHINLCNQFLDYQMAYSRDASRSRYSRYLTGTIGLYTIQAISDVMAGKQIDQITMKFKKLVNVVIEPGYQSIGDDEILNGRAGFLAACLCIKIETGEKVLSDDEIFLVLEAMLKSGRQYSKSHKSPTPLMYQWHDKEYLGAAHGLSGILQVLLSYWTLLDERARSDVKQTVDWFLSTQDKDGNFASSSGHLGEKHHELVHWCHGASGVIHMLMAAYVVLKDTRYLDGAERCASLIWKKGILRKGPGVCHGVSGNGYAFLLLYRLTSQTEYLLKAKAFAAIMMDPQFEKHANVPDSPYSLFEGWAGALCFLSDLIHPESAQFPMLPIPMD